MPPVSAELSGLHTKAVVVDREQVFIGSMNLDPRSFQINAEGGVFVQSPAWPRSWHGSWSATCDPTARGA